MHQVCARGWRPEQQQAPSARQCRWPWPGSHAIIARCTLAPVLPSLQGRSVDDTDAQRGRPIDGDAMTRCIWMHLRSGTRGH